ncbi:hypothetical protein F2Q69_00019132 [Brassica cretica]|uniref:Cyclic nucleotide-binding domain-containing protein n=1 Tax=Brassica cretica TaxID=69181 RepID=A0A8S9QB89_BRACR|nr:hypothetical protein F2Q69_00019132 [Brassica cretica]
MDGGRVAIVHYRIVPPAAHVAVAAEDEDEGAEAEEVGEEGLEDAEGVGDVEALDFEAESEDESEADDEDQDPDYDPYQDGLVEQEQVLSRKVIELRECFHKEHIERLLRDHFLFRKLTDSQCQVLLERLELNPGDVVVKQGGEGDCFCVVGSGEVEVLATQALTEAFEIFCSKTLAGSSRAELLAPISSRGSEKWGPQLDQATYKNLQRLYLSEQLDFSVVLEDAPSSRNNTGNGSPKEDNKADKKKRTRRPNQSNKFLVEISYAAMQAIAAALQGKETDSLQDAIRVLDVILRQSAARQGCLLQNFVPIRAGVIGVRGFHSSSRTTQGGLSLNIDTSTTMVVQPGPVVEFLLANQNVKDPYSVDWTKAKRALKSLRVKVAPSNREYKISGLSDDRCRDQRFPLKSKNEMGEVVETETTVYEYFTEFRKVPLRYSGDFPCINAGKPRRPTYIPIEHCELASLQRHTKSLTNLQHSFHFGVAKNVLILDVETQPNRHAVLGAATSRPDMEGDAKVAHF